MLFAIAYRMLGSVMDAEDVVQDAFLRWQEAPEVEVRSPRAYLTTIVTRLAINQLRSARVKRETYVGPWLPEPLVTADAPDPSASVELSESLSLAFLLLLERLSPVERAVFLLHEVFDFEYSEIAGVVEKTEANCRQLLVRAKKRMSAPEGRFQTDPAQARRLVERFTAAVGTGDLAGLLEILAEDITLWTDGGGKAAAARNLVHGADHVARWAIGVQRVVPADTVYRPAVINGEPGFIAYSAGRATAVLVFEIHGERIQAIYIVANPDKLQTLSPPS